MTASLLGSCDIGTNTQLLNLDCRQACQEGLKGASPGNHAGDAPTPSQGLPGWESDSPQEASEPSRSGDASDPDEQVRPTPSSMLHAT